MPSLCTPVPSTQSNLTGRKIHNLFVVGYAHQDRQRHYWWCICSCGRSKAVYRNTLVSGVSRTCGCRHGKSVREWLLMNREINSDTGCWLWTRGTSNNGYGSFVLNRQKHLAHRSSYENFVGPIPDGLFVCHKCDTPQCFNPDHLFTGTHADNSADMKAKGRGRKPTRYCDHLTLEEIMTMDLDELLACIPKRTRKP